MTKAEQKAAIKDAIKQVLEANQNFRTTVVRVVANSDPNRPASEIKEAMEGFMALNGVFFPVEVALAKFDASLEIEE